MFKIKIIESYVFVYSVKDVLTSLASDIDFMSAKFNLNSVTFVTPASFSWECTLKITKIELELLADGDMIFDYGNSIRGEISGAICHYGEANNKYALDYNETKESTYVQYLDFNNQYGWALSQPVPYNGFEYVENISMFTHNVIKNYNNNSDFGYTLIVAVDYPEYLQPLCQCFLLLPEKIIISKEKN